MNNPRGIRHKCSIGHQMPPPIEVSPAINIIKLDPSVACTRHSVQHGAALTPVDNVWLAEKYPKEVFSIAIYGSLLCGSGTLFT